MKNLIPKSLAKQKGVFYKNISWKDVSIFIIGLTVLSVIFFPIVSIELWIRAVIVVSLFIVFLLCTMPYHKHNDARFYMLIWYMIKYFVSEKKYENFYLINPYDKIDQNFVLTKKPKDGKAYYIAMIKIRGLDLSSLDEQQSRIKLDQFHSFIAQHKKHFSIAKINQKYSLSAQAKIIQQRIRNNKLDYDYTKISEKEFKTRKQQLTNQLEILNNIQKEMDANPMQATFYIIYYDINSDELKRNINDSINELNSIGLFAQQVCFEDEINIIKSLFNPGEEDISNETINANRNELDNIFCFDQVQFKKDHIRINEQLYMSCMSISDYPVEVSDYWLSYIFLSVPTNTIMNCKQINQSHAISLMNKAIVNSTSNQYNEKKQVQKMKYASAADNFRKMANEIINQEQVVFRVNLLMMNYDVDYKSLIKSNRAIEKILIAKSFKINRLKYRQFEGLSSFLPKINDVINNQYGREITSKTLANGYPFLDSCVNDNNGMILGLNWLKSPIIFDPFVINSNRKNHNILILGASGSGKSYLTKKMINYFAMTNKKVFILDIEREYKDLVLNYDGNWIDVGTSLNGIINPLQIMQSQENILDFNAIANHLLILETFFKILFPELNNQQLLYFTSIVKNYYVTNKYINKKITSILDKDWPIFDDIYKFALSKKNNVKSGYKKEDVFIIHEILKSEFSTNGKLSFLYNKHSSININKKIASIDVHSLFEKNNNRITQAQLFLSLNYLEKLVKNNDYTKDPIVIIIDEAHLMIDEKNPIALEFIYQMVKRIRKRNGSIIIISQNPDDFVANELVSKKTKAIINNTQYSFFFGLSPNNLKDVSEMYKAYGNGLSQDEKLFIAKAKTGQALFFVSGFDRHKIDIFVSKKEAENFIKYCA